MTDREFEGIYRDYAAEVKRFIFTAARRDASYTEEIFQNTWLNAYRYRGSLRDSCAARAWVYSIARNEAKRYFAENGSRFLIEVAGDDDGSDCFGGADEFDFPDALADSDFLARVLLSLKASQRQLVLLRFGYDMALTDIADMYRLNYNTLKSQMRRTLAALRIAAEAELASGSGSCDLRAG
jgi:RNA polymerase sigma-70 factor (ECF subfamily)